MAINYMASKPIHIYKGILPSSLFYFAHFFPVMTLHVRFSSISCFFALSFLVTTLVSLPSRRLDEVESLLAFKNEFTLSCNKSVTNSWTRDAIFFDGVLFDKDTGGVTELKLRGACLSGTLDANSSLFKLHQLRYLDLSLNNISSSLPAEFGRLTDLEFLDLHQNRFTGELPSSISNTTVLTKLHFLDISNNSLQGKVPEWVWSLPSLTATNLSRNSFDSFPNVPPTVTYLAASNNNFTGEIPLSLCNPKNLLFLDLSNNSLTGSVPRCLSESVTVLNLRRNSLTSLPDAFSNSSLKVLDVGHNQINGKLPRSLEHCKSLEFVDVEGNRINDTFPFWLKDLPNLIALILRSNRFYGPLSSPQHPLPFSKLMIIDIAGNMFDGSLPPNYFVNWSAAIRPRVKHIGDSYSLVDFSGNRFVGEIPESIGMLKSLLALNLSNNGFTGHIPSSMDNLSNLESLDISRNQLSGTIPQELGKLSFLSYINMSYNNLTGQIPQGTQFQTQNESAFEGNIDLCGFPLRKRCFRENVSATTTHTQSSHASKTMHSLNSNNPLLLFSILVVFNFVLSFYIPLSTSL
ncbi:receptor-like protein 20 [Brassica napus]|nr:receptor-like protein 20 [Brassica napus]